MIYLLMLILFPLVMAAVTFAATSDHWRPRLLPLGGLGHLVLVMVTIFHADDSATLGAFGDWLLLDALGKIVLGLISVLFFICSLYVPGYLALRHDRPNRVFC